MIYSKYFSFQKKNTLELPDWPKKIRINLIIRYRTIEIDRYLNYDFDENLVATTKDAGEKNVEHCSSWTHEPVRKGFSLFKGKYIFVFFSPLESKLIKLIKHEVRRK